MCSRKNAEKAILIEIKKGIVLIDVHEHRYIKSGNLFFPCVYCGNSSYKIKSVLTWEMVDYRLQNVIDNYSIVSDLL